MRIPDEKLAEVFDRGFTVVEGFLDKQTLSDAQEGLWDIYPRPEAYFADPAAFSKFTKSQFAGLRFFPYPSWGLNKVPVYPDLIDAAERFDLVFTSPPYFDVEVYQSVAGAADHGGQSIASFSSLGGWLRGWLFPAMDRAFAALREGGHMALYINDFDGLSMCRPMVDHAASMPDCRWVGVVGVEGETGKTRPLWVWRKGAATEPLCPLYRALLLDIAATEGFAPAAAASSAAPAL